jgi:hypothetical protein
MILRELYIESGAITPAGMRILEPPPPCLYMDDLGHAMAQVHMLEDEQKAREGELCEIDLFQVPDFVLEMWAKRERKAMS